MFPNPPPRFDGDVNQYISDEAFQSPWFDSGARAIADALVSMRGNLTRVQAVCDKREKSHNSDSDDVAVLYVEKLQTSPHRSAIVSALKLNPTLKNKLVQLMDEGWTGADEKAAIAFLKGI